MVGAFAVSMEVAGVPDQALQKRILWSALVIQNKPD